MQFGLLTIEVDGTLQNPYVVAGLLIWTVQLSVAMSFLLHDLSYRPLSTLHRWLTFGAVLFASYFVGRIACRLVSTFLYIITTPKVMSVGYWGAAPFWVPPLAAGISALTWALIRKKKPNEPRDGEQVAAPDGELGRSAP